MSAHTWQTDNPNLIRMLFDVARDRAESHVPNPTDDHIYGEFKGACGEYAFACLYGFPFDWSNRPKGDGGCDFVLADGSTVNVKAATTPKYIIVQDGFVKADRYVLGSYCACWNVGLVNWVLVKFVGWCERAEVLRAPIKWHGKYERDGKTKIMSHRIEEPNWWDMESLRRLIVGLKERNPTNETADRT